MSDIVKGLPIRTEGDASDKVQVRLIDKTVDGQGLLIDTDGAARVLVTGKDATGTARSALMSTTGQMHVIMDEKDADETPVSDFDKAVAVAVNASSTHTYTVPVGKTLLLKRIGGAASARARYEVKVGASGSETTRMARFGTSANPNVDFNWASEPVRATAGQNVLVIKTNTDNQAQDLYSHIIGTLI